MAATEATVIPSDSSDKDGKLQKAAADFTKGLTLLERGAMAEAVDLFGAVLEARLEASGAEAPETAAAYFYYGTALLRKAQEDSDVFGAELQDAARKRGSMLVDEQPGEEDDANEDEADEDEAEQAAENAHQAATEAADKVAAAAAAGKPEAAAQDQQQDAEDKSKENDEEKEEEAGRREEEAESDDMQLAWEMLEMAKLVYSKCSPAPASELADVHSSLADISMEQENFEAAIDDYAAAIQLLKGLSQGGTRQLAELQYKVALAQQFMELPEAALSSVKAAIAILEKIVAGLKPQEAAQNESFSFGVPEADAVDQPDTKIEQPKDPKVAAEIAELQSVLDDLWEKVDELKEAVASSNSTKSAIKAAFAQMASASNAAAASPPSPAKDRIPAHPAQQASDALTAADAPAAATEAAKKSVGGNVQDLGVVGRGKRRITLQPQRNEEASKRSKAEGAFRSGSTEAAASEQNGSAANGSGK